MIYVFEGYSLDTERHELHRGTHQVAIEPQVFDLLLFLIRNRGRVVSKDDLIAEVWNGRIVSESTLSSRITAVRRAIGDTGDEQRLIRTIARKGHRFIGHVREDQRPADASPERRETEIDASAGTVGLDTPERRQLTVMACSMAGSIDLSASLDPEDLQEVMAAYQVCVRDVVMRHGGSVAECTRDGALAYFGYPHAHEEDAERAVRAGLALSRAVSTLRIKCVAGPLAARVGIATGLVVVDKGSNSSAADVAAIGETPLFATRLASLAAPGAVVISGGTRRILGDLFEYHELRPEELQGSAKPAGACQVLSESVVASRFEALRSRHTRFIGREEEIDLLRRRWNQVKETGRGRVVIVTGEPGIGKSRLVATLEGSVVAERHARLRYFCSPHHTQSALFPITTQLERAARIEREDRAEARLHKLEALLAPSCHSLADNMPLFAALLGIPAGQRYPVPSGTPQRLKERTLNALLEQLKQLAAAQPVLMVFEDLHWIDPTSLELLSLLIEQMKGQRLLLLATARPEFTPPWPSHRHIAPMPLSRLDRSEAAAVVAGITGGKRMPPEVLDQIFMRTDGVPLFIEELTKALLESGMLREAEEGRFELIGALPLAIPATLHASLLARLDRVANAKEVAQIGATIGREFAYELLATTAALPEKDLNAALSQLVAAELVYQRGVPPNAVYQFKHALVQDTAYASLVRSRRQQLHGRIAQVLRGQFTETAHVQPEILAHHYGEASLPEQSVEYWQLAADMASKREAHREAISHCTRGLELVTLLNDPLQRNRSALRLLIRLGNSSISAKGWGAPEVSDAFERARALSIETGDDQSLHPVLVGLYYYHSFNADLRSAEKLAEETLAHGQERQDRVLQVAGHKMLVDASYKLGKFDRAQQHLDKGMRLSSSGAWDEFALEHIDDPGPYMLVYGGCVLWVLGYPSKARKSVADAVALARDRKHRLSLTHTVYMAGHLAELEGTWEEVKRANDETLALAIEWGFSGLQQQVGRRERLVAVAMHQDRGQMHYKREHPQPGFARSLHDAVLASAYGQTGTPAEGLAVLEATLKWTDETDSRFFDAEVHRVMAGLLAMTGRTEEAEAIYEKALSIARGQEARMWELRAACDLASLLRDQGRTRRAHDLLAPIYCWFTEGFDTPDLMKAQRLLDGFRY